MDISVHRQCRHPLQPMGGVCAMCLKERLSKLSGLCCKSDMGTTGNAGMKLQRQPSSLTAPPLKQHLGGKSDLCHQVEAAAEISHDFVIVSEGFTEARQSIAYLIERDIVEAHQCYSEVASRCCPVPSDSQLLRSKSTSQLDAYSSHGISNHRQSQGGGKNMKIKNVKEGMTSSEMKPVVDYHDLRSAMTPSCHCQHNGGELARFESEGKTAQPHLSKSKSTGWLINRHPMCDRNKRSERRSPIDLLIWNRKRKTSSVSNASPEDSAPLMMAPCSKKKAKDMMWRPLKILFRWRVMPRKPFITPPTASSGTPQSTCSSSSLFTQCAPTVQKRHCDLPKLDDHAELEHVMCGHRLRRLLSQVTGNSTFSAPVMNSTDEKMDADASVEQTMCGPREVVSRCSELSQDVDSLRQRAVLPDNVQSSALEQGNRGRAGGKLLLECGQGSNGFTKGRPGNELSHSPKSPSRVFNVANALGVSSSTRSSIRGSSACSALSSLSSSSPSLTSLLDTSMTYSNIKVKPDSTCTVSIAALISIDVNSTSPIKMAC